MKNKNNWTRNVLWLAACVVALSGGTAEAGTLYGLSTGNPGTLYTINPTTGAATPSATLNGPVNSPSLTDVAVLNGTFYASDLHNESAGSFDLIRFNPVTGATTDINDQGGDSNWHGLAANPNAGVLYAVDTGNGNLRSYNPMTNTLSLLGNTGQIGIDDLTYDAASNVLYGISNGGGFFSINTANGTPTLLGDTGLASSALYGLAFDRATGTFFVTDAGEFTGPTELYSFTLSTISDPTDIGSLGVGEVDGLEYVPSAVPDAASTAMLLGISLVGLCSLSALRRRCSPVAS